jgi:hypothetical protein
MSALKKASRTKSLSLSQDDFIFPRAPRSKKSLLPKPEDTQKIFKYIDENVIGKGVLFLGPYGRRKGEEKFLLFSLVKVIKMQ